MATLRAAAAVDNKPGDEAALDFSTKLTQQWKMEYSTTICMELKTTIAKRTLHNKAMWGAQQWY